MLICAENCNGLARHAMMAQGEQVHIASYPHGWFNGAGFVMADAVRIRTEGYCSDGKVFTIVSSMFLSDAEKDTLAEGDGNLRKLMDETPRNSSMIMGPGANLLAPVLRDAEGILYADIDLADSVIPKQFHDPAGYMNRFDIFELSVNRSSNDAVRFTTPTSRRPHLNEDLTAERAETWPRSVAAE
jgi:aliphatic nitrilase